MADVRLIDANALLKEFEKRQEQQTNEYCDCFLNDAQELSTEWWCVEDAVTAAPTIYAVPVVRCKECKYYNRALRLCNNGLGARPFEFYCADGAKMDGGASDG